LVVDDTPEQPTEKVLIYARISQDRGNRRVGVNNQIEQCRALAAIRGLTVIGEPLVDDDVSAYDLSPRPAFEEVKAALRRGDVDGVITWHPDRLYRRTADLLDLITIAKTQNFVIHVCRGENLDLRNPLGKMTAKLISSVTEYESEQKADRQALANRARARKGAWHGGPVPLGYRLADNPAQGIVKDEHAAAVLREAADRLLAKQSLSEVTRYVREQDIVDWRGELRWKNLKPISLKANLLSPTIVGKRAYTPQAARKEHAEQRREGLTSGNLPKVGVSLSVASWEPILDMDTWERLSALLLDPKRSSHGGRRPTKSFLGGRVFCWECRAPMGYSTYSYKCAAGSRRPDGTPGCGRVSVSTRGLEGHVDWFVRFTMPQRAQEASEPVRMDDPTPAIEDLENRKAGFRKLMTAGGYPDLAEYRADMNALDEEIRELRDKSARANRTALAQRSRQMTVEQWDDATIAQRRAYLESWPMSFYIKRADRGKKSGPRYDPDRTIAYVATTPERASLFKNLMPSDAEPALGIPPEPSVAPTRPRKPERLRKW
jgi:DNA invertase Pin-like site-specific DNA recombinase